MARYVLSSTALSIAIDVVLSSSPVSALGTQVLFDMSTRSLARVEYSTSRRNIVFLVGAVMTPSNCTAMNVRRAWTVYREGVEVSVDVLDVSAYYYATNSTTPYYELPVLCTVPMDNTRVWIGGASPATVACVAARAALAQKLSSDGILVIPEPTVPR